MGRSKGLPPTGRLAELLAALSLATDLGVGVPPETSLRACGVATHLGARLGLEASALRAVYYATLLRHLGCTAWSHEAAALVGDDHDLVRTFDGVDSTRTAEVAARAMRLSPGQPWAKRIRAAGLVLTRPRAPAQMAEAQCAQAKALAADLGFEDDVLTALDQVYERYDGRGVPRGLCGEQITPTGGLVQMAHLILALHRICGRDGTESELRRRRGSQLAPALCDVAIAEAPAIWAWLEDPNVFERVLLCEPEPHLELLRERMDEVALAFARFTDLKTPHTLGHSPAVAAAAASAARRAGWPLEDVERLRLASLLHDIGAVAVTNRIWEERGPLGAAAWEQVRLHAYYTERILAQTSETAPLAAIAGAHHERPDGTGYHRGMKGVAIGRSARLLAAADAFVAMGEQRPYRPAHDPDARIEILAGQARAGRLCPASVELLCAAAGRSVSRIAAPSGLTAREAETLTLLARGLSNKEISAALGISLRTVKHHIEHVYTKTGVSSRAAAALFAVRHDLVAPDRS